MKRTLQLSLLLFILLTLVLVACERPAAEPPTPLPFPTAQVQSPTRELTLPPTQVPTTPPTVSPTLPPAPTPTPENQGDQQKVKIYLVALEDNGTSGKKIGCNDSLVPVEINIQPTLAVLRASLQALLGIKEKDYGQSGLYNALYQSDLQIESLSIQDGGAIIHLSGRVTAGGVCDNPRIQGQLEETALQFSTIQKVSIFVNGKPLSDILSQKD